MDLRSVVYIVALIVMFVSTSAGEKKCTTILSRIPVHKDFNLDKFEGTWYTVFRTTWAFGENTYHSFSIEIKKHQDDTFHFSYTGQLGKKCLPVVSGILVEKGRAGHYIMKTGNSEANSATLIVSFTDYSDLAMVYYCFKLKAGSRVQCDDSNQQVEIISKNVNPAKKDIKDYMKRSDKRLCAGSKELESTKPGLCKIPDILKAAKQREQDTKKGGGKLGSLETCAVNNIPVQRDYSASQLAGLWYEIARTRYTFNKMESVVNYHRYDETGDRIYSYYTGTVVAPDGDGRPSCMTAIQGMSRTADDANEASDRLGRIGWDDNTAGPWSPTKILYADGDYTLFYACYAGPSDSRCVQEAMEVTLVGRTRSISEKKRESIYSILQSICVNPDQMIETQFLENCTSWVTIDQAKVEPNDCNLDSMKVYDDFDNSMLVGTWYLYASITYNNVTSLRGMVMEKALAGATEIIDTSYVGFFESDQNSTCRQYRSKIRDMCVDTGDHMNTLLLGDGNLVFSKVLYLDEYILVEYTCLSRALDGTCNTEGVQFHVYTKNDTAEVISVSSTHTDVINNLAVAVCLDPNQLQLESEWCNITDFDNPVDFGVSAECDSDSITIFSDMDEYSQEGIYGYWYEVSRSQDDDSMKSTIAYFTAASNDTLVFTYTGPEKDGDECEDVTQETLLARCRRDSNGDYLRRFSVTENYISYVPFKIIYTDYKQVLVTYSCHKILSSGQCAQGSAHLRIWSRNHTLEDETRDYAYEMAFWACLNPYQDGFLKDTHHENDDCKQKLEDHVFETGLDQIMTEEGMDEYGFDEMDDAVSQTQGDQRGRDKYALSDIEEALQVDDDIFYAETS